MKLFELANYINLHNINVKIEEGKLHVSGATADLTPAVVAAIKEYKSAIAAYCESRTSGAIPASDIDVAPLSFAQNRLYFLYLYDKTILHFNLPIELEMAGDFDPQAFQSALTHVISPHKIYKTTYFVKDGVAQQRHDGTRPIPLAFHDLSAASEDECSLALENARTMMGGTAFDLETELPVRISLLKLSPTSHRLLMAFHHIAADEWSIHQLLSNLARAYRSSKVGETLQSAPPAISYLDYAVWQNERHARGAYEVSRSFWKHQLANAPSVLELPLDKPRASSQTFGDGLLSLAIPAEVKAAASAFSRSNNISEFSLFLSVYYVLLYKLSGATDIIVGSDIFGREHAGLKNIAGFFVNQLALRCQFDPAVPVLDHIKRVNEMVSKSLDYQDMPFDRLVEEISPERDVAYSPIFQVKFLYSPTKADFNVFDGVQTTVNSTFSATSQYDLTLTVFGDQITAFYNNDLFHPATVESWMDSFIALAKCMLSDPAQVVSGLLQARLLEDFSHSARGAQRPVSIEHIWSGIEAAIAATPAAIAIQGPQECLTYAELDQRLQTVAGNLLKLGIKPQDRVGIFLERSPEMVIAIVATLRIGAVFVPLDPSYPPEHINYTLDDAGASIVISDDSLSDSLQEFYGVVLNIDSLLQGNPTLVGGYPTVDNEKIAYLLYTSGSTGRPKGVLVRRGALANLCDWYIDFASITSESKVILMIPIGFDASIKNIFSALMAGGTLVLAPTGIFDPDRLLAQIDQCQVSVLNAAPSAFYALVRQASADQYASLRSLKLVALGGEPLKSALLDPWLADQNCHATLANIYGPTECTDISIAFKATAAQWLGRAHAPIGRPIQNTMAYIVDENLALCLHGVAGELVVAGRGVAAGYQNDAQLASSPFIMSAYSHDPVYRTGDMCKYDADGNILFLGRRDGQIKIRGKRVEPDEIAHQIVRLLPGSLASIQLYANAGVETLLAFVEGRSTDQAGLDIRGELKKRLPRHMVPAQVYFVDKFPLSPNGKISGSALLAQVPTLKAALSQVIRPLNETEQLVAGVWTALLGGTQIEQDADFFTLGGDSILSIQVVADLRAHGIEIEVADIFKYPTLEQLAEFIAHNRHSASSKTAPSSLQAFALVPEQDRNSLPDGLEDAYPLTPLQLGMFIQTLSSDIETVYHDVFSFELTLDFSETLFSEAIQTVVSHHPILRTGFDFDTFSTPLQLVHANVPANILVYDITSQDPEAQNRFIAENIETIKSRSMPPKGPSLIRFSIFKKSSDCIQLVIDSHHAILDGWSMATVERQIFEHYRHLKDGKELADVFFTGGIRFVDYVAKQIEDVENIDSREFWDAYCATSGSGAIAGTLEVSKVCHSMSIALDQEVMRELKQVADHHGIQVKTLLIAAHAFTIQAVLGQRSLLTGVTDNGRPEEEGARNVVGLFVNVVPLHCDLRAKTWLELGRALQHADANMKPHRRFPFAHILQRNHNVKVDTLFTYTNFHVARQLLHVEGLEISIGEQYDETDFALSTLVSGNLQDGYIAKVTSNLDMPQSHIQGLLEEFRFALKSMVADFNAAIPLPSRLWVPAYSFEPRSASRQGEHFYLKFSGELNIDLFRQSAQQAIFRALVDRREYAQLAGLEPVVLRTWTEGDAKHDPLVMAQAGPPEGLLDVVHLSRPDAHFVLLHVSPQLLAGAHGQSCIGDIVSRYLSNDAEVNDVTVKTSASSSWRAVEAINGSVNFWRAHLDGAPPLLELPADRPRPAVQSHAGDSVALTIPAELAAHLRSLAQRHGATLFMTLLSGWSILLSRMSGQDDVVIGTPVANRQRSEVEDLIGFFVNTLALRVQLDDDPSVAQLLAQVKASTVAAYGHQDLPFEQVVEALRPPRSMSYSPIFQVMLSLNNLATGGELSLPGLTLTPVESSHRTTQFDLSLSLNDQGDAVKGALVYASDLFERSTIERLAGHFQHVLAAMVADEQQRVSALPLLSAPQRQQLLEGFNDTAAAYPQDQLVHQLFETQADIEPDAIALIYEDQQLTYGQLNRRANQVAHHLLALGVQPDDRVAICVDRSFEMVIGLIGILKAGAAYVPLDPNYPADRLAFMLADSAPVALLSQLALRAQLPAGVIPVLDMDGKEDAALLATYSVMNPDPLALGLAGQHLAYVIYTSGSTGMPKGVAMPHAALHNLLAWHGSESSFLAAPEKTLQFAALGFDVAFQEVFSTLCAGSSLVLIDDALRRDPAMLVRLIEQHGIERIFLPYIALNNLAEAICSAKQGLPLLRNVITAGEQLRITPAICQMMETFVRGSLHNHYGPTETHVVSTLTLEGNAASWPALPAIGRPLANTSMYILDRRLQPVPLGVVGEIHIGGVALARGYLKREELSAERFIDNPFGQGRVYKTGDLGRWLPDGTIEYQGRNDFQIKIRGFRIELGEIEARLAACAGVHESLVIAREDFPGDKRLVAYLVGQDGVALDAAALRASLASMLADHMIPSAFVTLDSFPLTANGKLDRRALPVPSQSALATRAYEAPVGATETALAEIWQELLGLPRVGRHDHFFELGGHSLLVITLIEQLRKAGRGTDVRTIFAYPTLSALAAALDLGGGAPSHSVPPNLITADSAAITPDMVPLAGLDQEEIDLLVSATPSGLGDIQDIYRLAPLQEGILFHHLLDAESDVYLLCSTIAFDSRARLDGFLAALQTVISRHDILRSSIHWTGLRHPVQIVHRQAPLPLHTLTLDGSGEALAQFQQLTDPRRVRVDLQRAPLLAAYVAACPGSDEWLLALLNHHLVIDHMTLEFMHHEILLLLNQQEDRLPPSLPYRNFIAQVHSVPVSEHEAFFRRQLADIDAPTAPFGLLDVQGNGTAVSEAELMIADEVALRIRALARQHGVTSGSLFHTAWAQVLARCTGRSDVVFGTVLSGRLQGSAGADQVLGMFINTLPIRISLADRSANQAVRETFHGLTELLGHEQASLALAQRCSGVPPSIPLFTTLLNFRHSKAGAVDATAWTGIRGIKIEDRTNYPITVSVDDLGHGFRLTTQCAQGIDAERINGYLHCALESLTQALDNSPERAIHTLDVLPASESEQLASFNDTAAPYPQDQLIHQLFEAQAAAQPDAVAVVFEDQQLTYDQLNRRANQLAHHLLALGVQPDDRVAICAERSFDMIVGLIGILKAGAAYVPLDLGYPADRLAYMLADSAPVALLTQAALHARLPAMAQPVVLLDAAPVSRQADNNPDPALLGLTSRHLAYVIYTSGSTGQPKGAMNEHRGVVNRLRWMQDAYGLTAHDVVLQKTPFSFDVSVWELFWPLISGARLLMARPDGHKDAAYLNALIREQEVTTLHFVPSMLQVFLEQEQAHASDARCNGLVRVVCSGEALPAALAQRFHAVLPQAQLYNLYGPTEAAVDVTAWHCLPGDPRASVPIGRPIANTQVYILDSLLQPVPIGVAGELYLGGVQVGRGYLNRPELSAERFLDDPFSSVANARMYKSGDLGRWLPDGSIEYQGRNDFQVKIRGFRIELGEIEARLGTCAGVREAVVLAREDVPGDKRLVAYLVAQDGVTLDAAALRTALAGVLADYMIPSAFVTLDSLPLTANGKLDRRALPAPDQSALVTRAYEAPVGPTETALAGIWQDLLGVPRVSRHDHFFELGGHSLLATQLLLRMRQTYEIEVPLRELFNKPTLWEMADLATSLQLELYLEEDVADIDDDLGSLSENELLAILSKGAAVE